MIAPDRRGEKRPAPPVKSSLYPRKIFHTTSAQLTKSSSVKCHLCAGLHCLDECPQFKEKSVQDRRSVLARLWLCYNCFGRHRVAVCPSSMRCITCKRKHHSLVRVSMQAHQLYKGRQIIENEILLTLHGLLTYTSLICLKRKGEFS